MYVSNVLHAFFFLEINAENNIVLLGVLITTVCLVMLTFYFKSNIVI